MGQGLLAVFGHDQWESEVCGQGDVVVIPGGTEHEAWFREDTEVIDFFAPPRDDFLLGGKPAYISVIHRLGYCSATRGSEGDGNFNCAGIDCHSIPARAR